MPKGSMYDGYILSNVTTLNYRKKKNIWRCEDHFLVNCDNIFTNSYVFVIFFLMLQTKQFWKKSNQGSSQMVYL